MLLNFWSNPINLGMMKNQANLNSLTRYLQIFFEQTKKDVELNILKNAKAKDYETIIKSLHKYDNKNKVLILYLATTGAYPRLKELETLSNTLDNSKNNYDLFFDNFFKNDEVEHSIDKFYNFKFINADKDTLYLNVSHTVFYHANSGVQRVIRETCSSMKKQKLKHALFIINQDNSIHLINDDVAERIYNWTKTKEKNQINNFIFELKVQTKFIAKTSALLLSALFFKSPLALLKSIFKMPRLAVKFKRTCKTYLAKTKGSLKRQKKNLNNEIIYFENAKILSPEIIIENSLNTLETLKKVLNVNFSIIWYDTIPLTFPEHCHPQIVNNCIQFLTILRWADKISCISATVKKELECMFEGNIIFRNDKPRIEAHLLAGDFNQGSKKQNTPNRNKILCVGTIESRKNWTAILNACEKLKDKLNFEITFVGGLGWKHEDFLNKLNELKHLGLAVKYSGVLSNEELEAEYASAKITVFASLAEGFGLPILESIQRGIPCVTSNFGSQKEIAEIGGGCILVNPTNVDEIANAIESCLKNDELLNKLKNEISKSKWKDWNKYASEIHSFSMSE